MWQWWSGFGGVLQFAGDPATFGFAEVAESAGVEAAEPAAKGAIGAVAEGAKSSGEFAPEDLDQFLGVGWVLKAWPCPGFEEGVVAGEETLPRGAIAPCVQSIQQ
jgi:hypothetical protein